MKKIIAFVGSARKEGYCSKTVAGIKKGAEEAGAEVVVYNLSESNIRPCQGCMYCRQGKGCAVTDDDMGRIYKDYAEADGVVFASPLYFGMVSGQSMVLINRLYASVPPKETKKAVAVFAHAAPGETTYKGYIDTFIPVLASVGLDVQDTIVCAGTSAMDDTAEAALFEKAVEAGKKLAE